MCGTCLSLYSQMVFPFANSPIALQNPPHYLLPLPGKASKLPLEKDQGSAEAGSNIILRHPNPAIKIINLQLYKKQVYT
jgi:hypothetical protein